MKSKTEIKYIISGDRTGITYGIHKLKAGATSPFDTEMVKGGFKTFAQAEKEIKRLKDEVRQMGEKE